MNIAHDIANAADIIRQGGVIAYPTEAVFGLGCDPFNQAAVQTIYQLKKRDTSKAFILIAASWEDVNDVVGTIPDDQLSLVMNTWPGPVTWIFPSNKHSPKHILGNETGIAIRITNHPIAKALCEAVGPIVSTSANPEGLPPAKTIEKVRAYFPDNIDLFVNGELGDLDNPTQIRDARTGDIIRA